MMEAPKDFSFSRQNRRVSQRVIRLIFSVIVALLLRQQPSGSSKSTPCRSLCVAGAGYSMETILLEPPFSPERLVWGFPTPSAAGSIKSVAVTRNISSGGTMMNILFTARSSYASGVYMLTNPDLTGATNNSAISLVGVDNNDANSCRGGTVGAGGEYTLNMTTYPNSLALVNQRLVILAEGLPGARALAIAPGSSTNPTTARNLSDIGFDGLVANISRLLGAPTCDFIPATFSNETDVNSTAIEAPDFISYFGATNQLFFSQKTVIASVIAVDTSSSSSLFPGLAGKMFSWLGSPGQLGQRPNNIPNQSFRLDVLTNYPGQMALVDDSEETAMYFPDHMGMIRRVDILNGSVTWILGTPFFGGFGGWPPPSCGLSPSSPQPCAEDDLYLVQVVALAAARRVFSNGTTTKRLYFTDRSMALLFTYDFEQQLVYGIAGTPFDQPSPPANEKLGSSSNQIALFGDSLLIADGNLRLLNFSDGVVESLLPDAAGCSVQDHCNGNALSVYGLPATGCICECKPLWTGPTCAISLLRTKTESITETASALENSATVQQTRQLGPNETTPTVARGHTLSAIKEVTHTNHLESDSIKAASRTQQRESTATLTENRHQSRTAALKSSSVVQERSSTAENNIITVSKTFEQEEPEEPEPIIPPTVVTVGTTTATVAAIANPTVAVHGARSSLLLKLGKCNPDFDDDLDWFTSVLQLEIGSDNLRFYRGAVIGNFIAFAAFCGLFIVVGSIIALCKKKRIVFWAFSKMRFPGLVAYPILFIFEGTVMASFVLMIHGGQAKEIVGGLIGALLCTALSIFVIYKLSGKRFDTTFSAFKWDKSKKSMRTCKGFFGYWLRWLFWEEGKWVNNEETQYRNLWGGFFRDYRPKRQLFMIAEFAMCLATGSLAAVHPDKGAACIAVVSLITLAYVAMFLAIVILRPYLQRFAMFFALAIAGLQAVSAIQLLILVITGDPDWGRASASVALASIYVLAIDGFLSLIDLARKIIYFLWKKCCKQDDERLSARQLEAQAARQRELPFMMGDHRGFNPAEALDAVEDVDPFADSDNGSLAEELLNSQQMVTSFATNAAPVSQQTMQTNPSLAGHPQLQSIQSLQQHQEEDNDLDLLPPRNSSITARSATGRPSSDRTDSDVFSPEATTGPRPPLRDQTITAASMNPLDWVEVGPDDGREDPFSLSDSRDQFSSTGSDDILGVGTTTGRRRAAPADINSNHASNHGVAQDDSNRAEVLDLRRTSQHVSNGSTAGQAAALHRPAVAPPQRRRLSITHHSRKSQPLQQDYDIL